MEIGDYFRVKKNTVKSWMYDTRALFKITIESDFDNCDFCLTNLNSRIRNYAHISKEDIKKYFKKASKKEVREYEEEKVESEI